MKENVYISLLYKQLSGDIEATERQQLESWMQASPENKQIAQSVEKAWAMGAQFTSEVEVDLDADFASLQERINREGGEKSIEGIEGKSGVEGASIGKRRSLFPRSLQIAAGILFLVAAGFLIRQFLSTGSGWEGEGAMVRVVTTELQKEPVLLADGSKVWLNARSTFSHPSTFTGNERRVKLSGEAFFEVAKDARHPFIIETKTGNIQVLGTSFTIRDFREEKTMAVDVVTGKVQVQIEETGEKLDLVKNQQGVYSRNAKTLKQVPSSNNNGSAWHTRKLIFSNSNLKEITESVASIYGVNIVVENNDLLDCTHTFRFNKMEIEPLLENIGDVFGMILEKENGNKYVLKGGKECESVD